MSSVLFAILFQSWHSYAHFSENKTLLHKADSHDKDLHQKNHHNEKCFVCEFTFNSFLASKTSCYVHVFEFIKVCHQFPLSVTPDISSRSTFSLRGPPSNC